MGLAQVSGLFCQFLKGQHPEKIHLKREEECTKNRPENPISLSPTPLHDKHYQAVSHE